MKLNNKGFALTSIIYMLIVLFLMMMLLVLSNLAQRKAVLDKIKSEVKQNLNQGGVIAQNAYIVTFDPTIGQIDQTTKQVIYGQPYGELPTPTREGYRFLGWTGKNLALEINSGNYTFTHFADRTTHELLTENGENYIRINGNSSTTNIDTMWVVKSKKSPLPQGNYTLSFDVRSENALATQYIARYLTNSSAGKTGLYDNTDSKVLSVLEDNFLFDNDGEWHHFTMNATISYSTSYTYFRISNDVPNLYGENSYLDIKNFQLERGTTSTSYEPYQEYTKDTIVIKQENHTLYAMWEPLYTVTFDANGGTLSDNTKQVLYNRPYGELPTPTRTGYTFMGWSGKNLFNKDATPVTTTSYMRSDGEIVAHTEYSIYQVNVKPNTTYTITNSGQSATPGYVIYDSSGTRLSGENYSNTSAVTFTTPATASYIKFSVVTKTDSYRYDKEIFQLEQGASATTYESYQEYTSNTTVSKQEDHTLHAIWQINS